MQTIQQALKEKFAQIKDQPLEIALTGDAVSGKTSFINAIRGVQEGDAGAIDVDEQTLNPQCYTYPEESCVRIWDFPPNTEVDLERYDLFLIFSSGRFSETVLKIAKRVHKSGKAFSFVRAMIDQDIYNSKRSHPKTHKDETMLQRIREDCYENLNRGNIQDAEVFLISNFERMKYDFCGLKMKLANKGHSMRISLTQFIEKKVDVTARSLEDNINMASQRVSLWCLVPIPGYFLESTRNFMNKEISQIKERFGLDDNSVAVTSRWAGGRSLHSLKLEAHTSPSWIKDMIDKESYLPVVEWLRFLPFLGMASVYVLGLYMVLENPSILIFIWTYVLCIIPIVWYTNRKVSTLLKDYVHIMKKDASEVFKKAAHI